MKNKPRPEDEGAGMAFLDVITCGFGAIVLLLLVTKPQPEPAVEPDGKEVSAQVEAAQNFVNLLRAEAEELRKTIALLAESTPSPEPPEEISPDALEQARQELAEIQSSNEGLVLVKESLEQASIRASMKIESRDIEVGGIPVEEEYVIFILDTSGSMNQVQIRGQVKETIRNILDIHPTVKGFQIMNDNGIHLLPSTTGTWLSDSPRQRNTIVGLLENWGARSNSSPVEGIETSILQYAKDGEGRMAIYILGDEFSGSSPQAVLDTLSAINIDPSTGEPKARIHAIGFFSAGFFPIAGTNAMYATLMQAVTSQSNGAFIALPVP